MNESWRRWIWFLRPTAITLVCYGLALLVAFQMQRSAAKRILRQVELPSTSTGIWESLRQPSETFAPTDVVRIQLEGMADKDRGRGAVQCFAFASPGNRLVTGPLPRFAKMVTQPPYDLLADADATVIGRTLLEDETTARVFVAALRGQEIETFVWILTRQANAPYVNCWMTDSVLLVDPRDPPSPSRLPPENET